MATNGSGGFRPSTAMVLAAGLGKRMRPLTEDRPKPLVNVAGRALVDHVLDRLAEAGISTAIVNAHYLADALEAHVAGRNRPSVVVSDERDLLLDTGGGIRKALPHLGQRPFLLTNTDSIWIDGARSPIDRLCETWDADNMDALLVVAPTVAAAGYDGAGDFLLGTDGRLTRRPERTLAPFVYTGLAILDPALFNDTPEGPFSLNLLFDRAAEAGRLFGIRLDGLWMHVGTPQAVKEAEQVIADSVL